MRSKRSRVYWLLICALLLSLIFPIAASGQGRWSRGHQRQRAVVVYNYHPRPYVTYRTRPYYSQPGNVYYRRPYYDRYYQSYGYWYAPVRHRRHDGLRLRLRW